MGRPIKTHREFLAEVYELVENEYSVLGDYINSQIKILFRHNICRNEFVMKPNEFRRGKRCPSCMRKQRGDKTRKSPEQFAKELRDAVGDEYEIIRNYANVDTKIILRHCVCGYEFSIMPNNFMGKQSSRCPRCASEKIQSKLATYLKKYFSENHGALEEYYDCPSPNGKGYLPYDIYIPSQKIYVEVQGQQHYEEIGFFHRKKGSFEKRLLYDKAKKEHAKRNGIYVEIDIREHDVTSAVKLIESMML